MVLRLDGRHLDADLELVLEAQRPVVLEGGGAARPADLATRGDGC